MQHLLDPRVKALAGIAHAAQKAFEKERNKKLKAEYQAFSKSKHEELRQLIALVKEELAAK